MMTEIDDDGAWLGLTICFTTGSGGIAWES